MMKLRLNMTFNDPPAEMCILSRLEVLMNLLYSRMGEYRTAADHYLTACSMNPSFVHRGNLDPEISALIEMFGLNREE